VRQNSGIDGEAGVNGASDSLLIAERMIGKTHEGPLVTGRPKFWAPGDTIKSIEQTRQAIMLLDAAGIDLELYEWDSGERLTVRLGERSARTPRP
jgi:hypothetical protein